MTELTIETARIDCPVTLSRDGAAGMAIRVEAFWHEAGDEVRLRAVFVGYGEDRHIAEWDGYDLKCTGPVLPFEAAK